MHWEAQYRFQADTNPFEARQETELRAILTAEADSAVNRVMSVNVGVGRCTQLLLWPERERSIHARLQITISFSYSVLLSVKSADSISAYTFENRKSRFVSKRNLRRVDRETGGVE